MSNESKPKPNYTWKVRRVVVEEFEVTAASREEARLNIQDPHTITVVKEIIKKVK